MANVPSILDVTPGQLEVVEKEMQKFFESSDQLVGKVRKSSKVKQISRFLYRIPFKQYQGGAARKYSANNASLGHGTGMKLSNFEAGYITSILAFRVTTEQMETTETAQQSVINVWADTVANAMEEMNVHDDIWFHGDGTGLLTNASSAQTTTTLTFANATDYIGINQLREGMAVDVWKSDLSVCLTTTVRPIIITSIDYIAKTITLDQVVTGMNSQTNVVTVENLQSYGPATPTSFSSTWPDKTVAGGLGGDSWRHGFRYAHDVTGTDYYLGVLRSSIPQINPARVNASNGGITFDHGQLMIDQLIQRRTIDMDNQYLGVSHMAQRMAIQKLGTTINNVFIQASQTDGGKSKDLLPTNHGYKDAYEFCGIPMMNSKRQDKSRLDFLELSKWARAELHPIRFKKGKDGKQFFEGRGSDGTVQSFEEFFVEGSYDYCCLDPGGEGMVDSLAIPTGA